MPAPVSTVIRSASATHPRRPARRCVVHVHRPSLADDRFPFPRSLATPTAGADVPLRSRPIPPREVPMSIDPSPSATDEPSSRCPRPSTSRRGTTPSSTAAATIPARRTSSSSGSACSARRPRGCCAASSPASTTSPTATSSTSPARPASLGLSVTKGTASPFAKAVHALRDVRRSCSGRTEAWLVRRRVPLVSQRHLGRLPDDAAVAHHAQWTTTTIHLDALRPGPRPRRGDARRRRRPRRCSSRSSSPSASRRRPPPRRCELLAPASGATAVVKFSRQVDQQAGAEAGGALRAPRLVGVDLHRAGDVEVRPRRRRRRTRTGTPPR